MALKPSPAVEKAIEIAVIVIAFLALGWFVYGAYHSYMDIKATIPAQKAKPAAVATEIKSVPLVTITPPKVKVYAPEAKSKMHIPEEIVQDAHKHVISTAHIQPSTRPQSIATVFDDQTGMSKDYVTQEPLPWLAVDLHGDAGMYYGMKNGYSAVRFEAHQNLLDVKAVTIGITASVDQMVQGPIQADWFVGVGAAYRW